MNSTVQIYWLKSFTHLISLERLIWPIVVFALLLFSSFEAQCQKGTKIRTVVIDPGHGGKDPGAVGKNSKEKDIVLSVALKTGGYIKQNLPDVKVIYTRSKDEFIELYRRAAIANENNADVFISIHCNASKSKEASGSETFVMGEHRSQANLDVAMLENNAILYEENAEDEYGGFDLSATEAYIALNLVQSAYKQQSIQLAQKVQQQFTERVGRKDRSVQQAGFLVLYKTTMPSILIELGFISNPSEEAFLRSEKGQVFMSSAIYRAFKEFKTEFEKDNSDLSLRNTGVGNPPSQDPDQKDTAKRAAEAVQPPKVVPEKLAVKSSDVNPQLEYRVQFATFPREIPLSDKRFKDLNTVRHYFHNGLWKYTTGIFKTFNEAVNHQNAIRKKGYADAFVVIFASGKRISLEEAKALEKK
jgi:N-acetylmuramoyl-L-alanine amidase